MKGGLRRTRRLGVYSFPHLSQLQVTGEARLVEMDPTPL